MATKPKFGRKSDQPDDPPEEQVPEPVLAPRDPIDLGPVAQVFAIFGIISLVTSAIFLSEREVIVNEALRPAPIKLAAPAQQSMSGQPTAQSGQTTLGQTTLGQTTQNQVAEPVEPPEKLDPNDPDSKYPVRDYAEVGPFRINKAGVVLSVAIKASLPDQSWAFVEAELLDDDKDYLFSFGNELWSESGYDDGGPWHESDDSYVMKLTIPQAGAYYINIKTQGTVTPQPINVRVSRRLGSSIPHFAFGVIALLIGFALNEYKNRTTLRLVERMIDR